MALHTAVGAVLLAQFQVMLWAASIQPEDLEFFETKIRPVLVNLHTAVIGKRPPVSLAAIAAGLPKATLEEAKRTTRPVWFDNAFHPTPIYVREHLPSGARFDGPAIIEQLDCTTVIEPGNRVEVDPIGNLIVSV